MSAVEQTIDLILKKSGDVSKKELIKEISLLIALSKRDRYEIECKKFEQKYQTTFDNFERTLHSQNIRKIMVKKAIWTTGSSPSRLETGGNKGSRNF